MAKTDSIPPFPSDINRDDFGHWLSGFTDGEGTFFLGQSSKGYHVRFAISLRQDDRPILETIQSFFGCGRVANRPNYSNRTGAPLTILEVRHFSHLQKIIVPNFRRFPLFAKKRRDFELWAQGVNLVWTVNQRKTESRGFYQGTFPKWTEAERLEFQIIHDTLRHQRRYNSSDQPPPATKARENPFFFE